MGLSKLAFLCLVVMNFGTGYSRFTSGGRNVCSRTLTSNSSCWKINSKPISFLRGCEYRGEKCLEEFTIIRFRTFMRTTVYACCKGWTRSGDECTIPICVDGCENGGTCYAPGKCRCLSGFQGDRCELVNGGVSEWSAFGACSKSCGGGTKKRTRTCTNPIPSPGGKNCEEKLTDEKTCNEQECTVDEGLSQWSEFGLCSKTCGGGVKKRTRTCTNPARGGKECEGKNLEEIKSCNNIMCFLAWRCEWKYTNFADDGGSYMRNKASYLDQHTLNCGEGKMMQSFQLERNSQMNMIRYKYKCCDAQLPCKNKVKATNVTTYGDDLGNPIYLDRHNVQCNDQFLTYFQLLTSARGKKWHYQYKCCQTTYSKQCDDKHTDFDSDGESRVIYLDRHNVQCPKYYGITQFNLNRNSALDKYRYSYRCCTLIQP